MIRRREKPVILYHLYNAKDEYGQPRLEWDEKITTSGLYIMKGIFTRMSPEYEDIDGTLLLKENTFGPDWLVSIDDKNYRIQYVYPQMNCNRYTSYYLKSTKEEPTEHLEYGVYYKVEEYTIFGNTRYRLCLRNLPQTGYTLAEFPEVDTAPAWADSLSTIDVVRIETELHPTTMYRWFDACGMAHIEGLSNIDLTECKSLQWTFRDCINLVDDIKFSTTAPVNTSLRSTFKNCVQVGHIDVTGLCPSTVTSLNSLFHTCRGIQKVEGLETFDTSNCTELNNIFNYCENLVNIDGIADWDTGKGTSMQSIFYGCQLLRFIDISKWSFASATTVANLFRNCYHCRSINIKKFTPTIFLTSMSRMFDQCNELGCINCDDITCAYPEGCTITNVFNGCYELPNWGAGTTADAWSTYVVNNASTCPIPVFAGMNQAAAQFTIYPQSSDYYYYTSFIPPYDYNRTWIHGASAFTINIDPEYWSILSSQFTEGDNWIRIVVAHPGMLCSYLDYNYYLSGKVPAELRPRPSYDAENQRVYIGDCSSLAEDEYFAFRFLNSTTHMSYGLSYYWKYGDYFDTDLSAPGDYVIQVDRCKIGYESQQGFSYYTPPTEE